MLEINKQLKQKNIKNKIIEKEDYKELYLENILNVIQTTRKNINYLIITNRIRR